MAETRRGINLEAAINQTAERYRSRGIACITKSNPKVVQKNIDGRVVLTRFKGPVDFEGVCQGIPIAFDAKETSRASMPLVNVHDHQLRHLQDFTRCRGLGFLMILFNRTSQVFAVTPAWFLDQLHNLDRASVHLDAFLDATADPTQGCFKITIGAFGVPLHFSPAVQDLYDLVRRERRRSA